MAFTLPSRSDGDAEPIDRAQLEVIADDLVGLRAWALRRFSAGPPCLLDIDQDLWAHLAVPDSVLSHYVNRLEPYEYPKSDESRAYAQQIELCGVWLWTAILNTPYLRRTLILTCNRALDEGSMARFVEPEEQADALRRFVAAAITPSANVEATCDGDLEFRLSTPLLVAVASAQATDQVTKRRLAPLIVDLGAEKLIRTVVCTPPGIAPNPADHALVLPIIESFRASCLLLAARWAGLTLALVKRAAQQQLVTRSTVMDVVRGGNRGLVTAAAWYDWRRIYEFQSYARWWVWKGMGFSTGVRPGADYPWE
ncbi:MAG: hypothetical protein RIF41_34180 [Polyangiaceae bacterium]